MARRSDSTTVPPVIERFVKSLVVTAKAALLYPPSSNIPLQTAEETAAVLSEALRESSELTLSIAKDGILYLGSPVHAGTSAYRAFAFELYTRKLADVRFHSGTSPKDLVSFLSLLRDSPDDIEAGGGFESRLWEQGVGTITVTESDISLVENVLESQVTALGLSKSELDEVLASAYAGRNREQVVIARFLGERPAVTAYLAATFAAGGSAGLRAMAERVAELAEVAYEVGGPDSRQRLLRELGEALSDLGPEQRRNLLSNELLPEARTNEAVASVIRQFDLDDLCGMLVENVDESKVSQEGLARAVRSLALISMAERDEVVSSASAAMQAAGVSERFSSGVLEMTAPQHVTVRERASAQGADMPAESILRLMDLAPSPQKNTSKEDEPRIAALAEEARRGITDGDVIMALVSLTALDTREQQFNSTMSLLEDSLDLLIERGELDIAADAADGLRAAAENPKLTDQQRERLRNSLGKFTKPADVRALAEALRLYPGWSPEHLAARRLLDAMGSLAVDPLLEQLAEEPDMVARKSLVDLLSQSAATNIPQLGAYVSDSRWYVVRNVVSILGSTHSMTILPYLERTIRHTDGRVRREAIRALSSIPDRLAHQLLVVALEDEDAQNVQLAARYLGAAKVASATQALEVVARGEGRGNRETGPRVEAIEALGRIGDRRVLETLKLLAGKRALIGSARSRELRAAAESAIERIVTAGGGGR